MRVKAKQRLETIKVDWGGESPLVIGVVGVMNRSYCAVAPRMRTCEQREVTG